VATVRVLFLDIDGVLHPAREPGQLGPSDLYMVVGPFGWLPYLAKVLEPFPDVELVVHSTWRETFSLDELRDMLSELGTRSVDVAPAGERHDAIQAWLRDRAVASYRILDDDASAFPSPTPAQLIICDPRRGVSADDVLQSLSAWLAQPISG